MHYEKFQDGTVKCIEDEIPFEVPEGWSWCRLRDLLNVCSSKRVLQSDWKNEGIPFYRAREIVKLSENDFVENDLFISKEHYLELEKNYGIPQSGDLMVSGVGTIGKVYIVKPEDQFYYKDASVLCFENRNKMLVSKFAKILLESSFVQLQMRENSKGTTVDTITISAAMNYLCIVPPQNEQVRIVAAVQQAIVKVNEIQFNKDNLHSTITILKSKILDLAIRGKLVPQDPNDEPASVLLERIRAEKEELIKHGKIKRDKKESVIFKGDDNSYYEKIGDSVACIDAELPFEIPDSWCWARLSSFTEVIMGSSPRSQDICSDSNYTEFHQGKIYFSDYFLKESNQYTKKISKIAPENSVLLCVRAPVGEVNITDREICIGRGLSSIHAYDKIQNNFLFYWLKTQKRVLVNKSTGSTFSAITIDTVKNILLPIPPINEQLKITQKILDLNSNIESIKASLS